MHLARVYRQRGNGDGECTTVVSDLPREVAVLYIYNWVSDPTLEGDRRWYYPVLVELETLPETGLCELVNNVVLFCLCQQRAPGQLWKSWLSTQTGGDSSLASGIPRYHRKGTGTTSSWLGKCLERSHCYAYREFEWSA